MRNLENALTDVMSRYKRNSLSYDIQRDPNARNMWILEVRINDVPGSLLKIEIINNNGYPACCVLEIISIRHRSMEIFMDRLTDALDDMM